MQRVVWLLLVESDFKATSVPLVLGTMAERGGGDSVPSSDPVSWLLYLFDLGRNGVGCRTLSLPRCHGKTIRSSSTVDASAVQSNVKADF